MSEKSKPKIEEMQQDVPGPEVAPIPEEEQPVNVSLVEEEKTEEIPVPLKLVEESPETGKSAVPETAEPSPAEMPPAEEPLETPKKPGALKWMFDPATGRGRFMRSFARWAAIVIGLFALGFLVAYLALYQPAAQRLEDSREETASLMAQLKTTQGQLESVQAELASTQDLLLQAQTSQSETELQVAQLNNQRTILEILYDVTAARLAWMTNDRVVALALLVNAEAMLNQVSPEIEAKDPKLADFVNEQLLEAMNGIKNNAPSIPNSLEKLHRTVQTLERLFGILTP